jgi:hypothetical protein
MSSVHRYAAIKAKREHEVKSDDDEWEGMKLDFCFPDRSHSSLSTPLEDENQRADCLQEREERWNQPEQTQTQSQPNNTIAYPSS